jgi:hypothetical protein
VGGRFIPRLYKKIRSKRPVVKYQLDSVLWDLP